METSLGDAYPDCEAAQGPGRLYLCVLPFFFFVALHASHAFSAVSVVSPHMGQEGWPFADVDPFPGADTDPLNGAKHVKDLYLKVQPDYDGRYARFWAHTCGY